MSNTCPEIRTQLITVFLFTNARENFPARLSRASTNSRPPSKGTFLQRFDNAAGTSASERQEVVMSKRQRCELILVAVLLGVFLVGNIAAFAQQSASQQAAARQVFVPDEDRFQPFAITIRVGQSVTWVNNDVDDHTIVSDDFFNTAGNFGTNVLLPANGGTYTLTFSRTGAFPYYCRFHAHLDSFYQPVAPGPDGGIQNPKGNYGTPMAGVITVVPE
jgi:plastocyanin